MSSLKDKRVANLAKIAKQKQKLKEQVYTMPKIKMSTSETQKKAQKTFIPNEQSLATRSKNEDNMREFLAEVNRLTPDDFDIPPGGYTNPIVATGYKLYETAYISDTVKNPEQEIYRTDVIKKATDLWLEIPTIQKLLWVIKGYGYKKDAEWGRKQFTDKLSIVIYTDDALQKFIDNYLSRNISYTKSIDYQQSQLGKKEEKTALEVEITTAQNDDDKYAPQHTRPPLTTNEQERLDDLQDRLNGYQETVENLREKMNTREEFLTEKSQEELIEIAVPIIGKKTNEHIIATIFEVEYRDLINANINKLKENGQTQEQYDMFMNYVKEESEEKKSKLHELSHTDLVLEVTKYKTAPQLVKMIIYEEFHKSQQNLNNKIIKLKVEIHNLSLGKYVPFTKSIKKLTYNERKYLYALLVQTRRIELETKTDEQLRILSGATYLVKINITKPNSRKTLIDKILQTEFPGVNPSVIPTQVTFGEMKSVLMTLSEDQLHVIAYTNGIKHPEHRGKYRNIESILYKEFPNKTQTQIKELVEGKVSRNFNIVARRAELESKSSKEIQEEALIIGIEMPHGTSSDILIKKILVWEENISKLIPKEEAEKQKLIDKISELTGFPPSRYQLWSKEELDQRLFALSETNQEYWTELEQERLYNKLSQLVDVKKKKYAKAKTWSLKKLRRELEKIGGENWETYQPLVEDYSFVKCMELYHRYDWIDGKVTGVWLSSDKNGQPDKNYIYDVTIEEDGHLWYQANRKFVAIQCDPNSKKRQHDDVLVIENKNKIIKFKVGYTIVGHQGNNYKSRMIEKEDGQSVRRTFAVQDEEMFLKEKQFFRKNKLTENDHVKDILKSSVTQQTLDNTQQLLSKKFLSIAPLKKDYGVVHFEQNIKKLKSDVSSKSIDSNTPYMQILMSTLHNSPSQTKEDLYNKIANIIIYLNIPEANTFRKNIENEYYLPDILATLSPAEKFPEVFQDPTVTTKEQEQISTRIDNQIKKFVHSMGATEYRLQNPTQRVTTISSISYIHSLKTNKRLNACENKARVKGIPETEIVYYKENDKIYCFSVQELYNRFLIEEEVTNPETGNQFDINFVTRFSQLYNKKLSDDGLLTAFFQKKYGFDLSEAVEEKINSDTIKSKFPVIATDLWDVIGKDIAELEDQLSNEAPADGDEIDEDREEEKRDAEVEAGDRETRDIDENDVCEYCKNHLSNDSIKSIIFHNNESRIIKFCSFKCFEDKNDWSKFKIKKERKEKKKVKTIKKKVDAAAKTVKAKIDADNKSPDSIKLSRDELKKRKKVIKKQIKDGIAAFDKVAFPLMSKTELKDIAKEKKVVIPGNLSKMGTAAALYKALHPKSKTGIFKEKTAEKEFVKYETRRDKKKRKSKETSTDKKAKK
jgi:hypothetical protein